MRVMTAVKDVVRQRLVARAGGVDLSRLDRVPESLSWPLRRDGTAPSVRLLQAGTEAPVQRLATLMGLQVWLVTGDAESRAVLADAAPWSTDIRPYVGRSGSATDGDIGGLGFTDPPDHTRLRRLITPEFTMRRLQRLRPAIEGVVQRQLDEVAAALLVNSVVGDPVDLVPSFCFPVPFLVICELLGLPDERREVFAQLATQRFDVSGGGAGAIGAIGGSRQFLFEEVARQRREPGPGLIGQIIRDHGDSVTDFELGGLADGVFTGGLETSASMLALGTAHLLEDRALWQRLGEDPADAALVPAVVEELLRLLSVVQVAFPRFARHDVEVGGVTVPRGSMVLCSLPAANRDARAGHGPELDVGTASRSHLAFGHGLHRCVGAELARMELAVAFPALARRFPDLRTATRADELTHRPLSIVFGLESLPVRGGRGGRPA
jgi:cytochrome P450